MNDDKDEDEFVGVCVESVFGKGMSVSEMEKISKSVIHKREYERRYKKHRYNTDEDYRQKQLARHLKFTCKIPIKFYNQYLEIRKQKG